MTIRQEDNGTYCFSFGGMCWDQFPSREAAQTALYDLQRGRKPDLSHLDERIALAREADRILAAPTVTYRRMRLTDGSSPNEWDEYVAGGWVLAIEDGALLFWSRDSELGQVEAAELADLRALLNDARVVAAVAAQEEHAAA